MTFILISLNILNGGRACGITIKDQVGTTTVSHVRRPGFDTQQQLLIHFLTMQTLERRRWLTQVVEFLPLTQESKTELLYSAFILAQYSLGALEERSSRHEFSVGLFPFLAFEFLNNFLNIYNWIYKIMHSITLDISSLIRQMFISKCLSFVTLYPNILATAYIILHSQWKIWMNFFKQNCCEGFF